MEVSHVPAQPRPGERSEIGPRPMVSRCERLLEDVEQVVHGRRRNSPEMANQPRSIHGPKLIDDNLTVLAGEAAWPAKRVAMRGRGHGRDNDCSQMSVQVVGGHDHAGSRLLDLGSSRGVEIRSACAMTAFGNRTPRELPMRMICALMRDYFVSTRSPSQASS